MGRLHRLSAGSRRGAGFATALLALATAATTTLVLRSPETAAAVATTGYWLVGTDGGVFNFGQAGFHGSTGGVPLNQPIVGLAATPSGRGYWMVAADGGIFSFGDAGFWGSMGGKPLNKPIVALAATRTGQGYWMVSSDGGLFSFGDAGFYGSMAGSDLNKPIVDIVATPTGRGYWLASSEGGVFAFGDAEFFGSTGALDLSKRIQAMTPTPTGRGYWMVAGDGGVFAFGDAGFYGSASGGAAEKRVIDIAPSATGAGYYVTASNGQVLAFGDAKEYGGTDEMRLNNRIAAMATMSGGEPPVAVEDAVAVDEDVPVTIDVLSNDRDPEGGQLVLKGVGAPLRGIATPSGRGVSYTPNPDYNGTDFFTYTLSDDAGNSATGRVNLNIKAVDDKPVVVPDPASGPEDTPLSIRVLDNDTGLGDGIKTVTVTDGPAHGKATVSADRTIAYMPEAHYTGDDTFVYKVTDNDEDSATGKVTVTLTAVDNVPATVDDAGKVRAGKSGVLDVTSNDDSPDGISFVKFADETGKPMEAAEVNTAAKGTAKRDAGKIHYSAPKGAFSGPDSFRYVVVDKDGDVSPPATVRVTVEPNMAPTAQKGKADNPVSPGESVLIPIAKLARDPENDPLTFMLHGDGNTAKGGHVTLNKDGGALYTAPSTGPTVDEFNYKVSDGNQESNIGTVYVDVTAPGKPATTTTTSVSTSTSTSTAPPAAFVAPLAGASGLARRWRRQRLGKRR